MTSQLTKLRLTSAWQCQKRLWLETYQGEAGQVPSPTQQRIIEQGIEVGNYARQYFSNGILIEGKNTEEKIQETQTAIERGETCLFEATFSFDSIVVKCDILLQDEQEKWQLIEVKSSTKVKDEHLLDLAIQKYVLAGNDIFISSSQVMHINRDCVYPDLSNLFIRTEVNQQLKAVFSDIPQLIRNSQNTLEKQQVPDIAIGKHCDKPHPCPFKSLCWEGIEEPTLLSIPNLRGKKLDQINELLKQGIYSLHDLPDDFPLTEKQAQAVKEKLNPEFRINEQGILDKFLQLEYPLYFFDFETFAPAIPRFEGLQPYQPFPFQYSCHILHPNGELEYQTYLHQTQSDPRKAIIESLLKTLGEIGSIIVYYSSFEAQRLGELAEQFPEYQAELNAIKDRLWDQWKIFKNDYQHPDFGGSTSLKKVLPVLVPEMSYDNLDIRDGEEAQAIWDLMIQGKADEETENILAKLRDYSEQDTYAMVAIHQAFVNDIIPEMKIDTEELLHQLQGSFGLKQLQEQLQSSDQSVRIATLQQLHNYGEKGLKLLDQISIQDKEILAQNKQTPSEILEQLATHCDWDEDILFAIANNPNTPCEIAENMWEELSESSNIDTQEKLASDPNTPIDILKKLASMTTEIESYADLYHLEEELIEEGKLDLNGESEGWQELVPLRRELDVKSTAMSTLREIAQDTTTKHNQQYRKLTVKELKELARKRGIKDYSQLRKQELIQLHLEWEFEISETTNSII